MALGAIMAEVVGNMIRIICPVEIVGMAGVAVGRRILVTVSVASDTLQRNMSPCQREAGVSMIKARRLPGGGGVANRAVMVKIILDMIGVRGPIKVVLMT